MPRHLRIPDTAKIDPLNVSVPEYGHALGRASDAPESETKRLKTDAEDDKGEQQLLLLQPVLNPELPTPETSVTTIDSRGFMVTPLTPIMQFDTREALMLWIKEFALVHGFGIVIAHSNKKAIYFTCELGGDYRRKKGGMAGHGHLHEDDAALQLPVDQHLLLMEHNHFGNQGFAAPGQSVSSANTTKKTRCPFLMTANHKKLTRIWTLKMMEAAHNHPKLDPLTLHPMLRKRLEDLNMTIIALYKTGTKPLVIEKILKDRFPKILIKREDIYNEIRSFKRKLRMGIPVHVDDNYAMGVANDLSIHAANALSSTGVSSYSGAQLTPSQLAAAINSANQHRGVDYGVHDDGHDGDLSSNATAAAAVAAVQQSLGDGRGYNLKQTGDEVLTSLENIDTRLVDGGE